MERDKIFFDVEGLTSTSANHLANLAKEYIQTVENELESITLYSTNIELIGTESTHILSRANADIHSIADKLNKVAEAKSLIAWLREALKAKERLQEEVNSLSLRDFCALKSIIYNEAPSSPETMSEDDYLGSLNIKERERYYHLETLCAVYGKYIHPNGVYANARKKFKSVLLNPTSVQGSGKDTIIYKYTPATTAEEVDKVFFELQDTHRNFQAELNGMKHKMEIAIEEYNQNALTAYRTALSSYSDWHASATAEFQEYISQESARIRNLKIVIPNNLTNIYNIVKALGK